MSSSPSPVSPSAPVASMSSRDGVLLPVVRPPFPFLPIFQARKNGICKLPTFKPLSRGSISLNLFLGSVEFHVG